MQVSVNLSSFWSAHIKVNKHTHVLLQEWRISHQ